jgi:hypothetical protein
MRRAALAACLVLALATTPLGLPAGADDEPVLAPEGCGAFNPGQPTCEYTAVANAGVSGSSDVPRGWTVTIVRPGEPDPIVIHSLGGSQLYACGTIRPGDTVTATANAPWSFVAAGNPGFCF